jgi:two-component sensor histidine kinase
MRESRVTELERLAAVRRYTILDTPPDGAFDRITAIAARLLNVPIAIISIVDHDRIWFKSRHGIDVHQVDRDVGFCASCILQNDAWIVDNAKTDVRALGNPLVAGDAGIRFYLGIPLRTPDGFNLGTLCVLDVVPRTARKGDVAHLTDLAAVVMDELELHLSARRALAGFHEELARRELREDHIKGLLRELAHRSKNLLAVVLATARHTVPEDAQAKGYANDLTARVRGLARTHDLIAEEDWRGANLEELASRQIGERSRVELAGPDVTITPAAAQHIGMALHELAANAARHGALSSGEGRVSFVWQFTDRAPSQKWLHMIWRELGGPPVTSPARKGFGHLVLERLAPEGLGGEAALSFAREGVIWSCETPSTRIVQ